MKSKHYIETIEDIKYCEEKGLTIYSDTWSPNFFRFVNGVWCMYSDKELKIYNHSFDISYDELYYKNDLKEEPTPEATEKDVGKLCWFWDNEERDGERSILKVVHSKENYPYLTEDCNSYVHCRRLSPSEVAEITGYKVEEK